MSRERAIPGGRLRPGPPWHSRSAVALWLVYAAILALVVLATPHRHTVTAYRDAAANWIAHRDLYDLSSIDGFLYLPQSAIAFVPQLWFSYGAGEVGWRWIGLGLLALGIWTLTRRLPANRPWFLILSALAIPASLASARNGQTNLHLAACFLWIALALEDSRWNLAAFFLIVTLILKPVSLVPILLVGALYAPMRLRLLGGLALFAVLPFLDPDWKWVVHQFVLCQQKLAIASEPMEHRFCDFSGMLWTFGLPLSPGITRIVGIVMAFAVLGLGFLARKVDLRASAFWVIALSSIYLMLFNPRTESNSYVILGSAVLPFLADAFARGSQPGALGLGLMLIALGCDSYSSPIHPWTHLWLKALLALAFLVYLAVRLVRKEPLKGV